MLEFHINRLPVSYNKSFNIIYNMKEVCLTPEAHLFKNQVKMSIPPCDFKQTDKFCIEIEYHSNFVNKNGTNRKIDLQNLDKLLIDAIFEKLGLCDSAIFDMIAWKVQSNVDKTIVRLRTIQ